MLQRFLKELYNFETQLKVSINFVCEVPWYLTTLLMKSKTELFTGGATRTICNFRVGGETDLLRRGRHFLFDLSSAGGVSGGFVVYHAHNPVPIRAPFVPVNAPFFIH